MIPEHKHIKHLKNKHDGEDIYVLGAGRSMDFYPRDFFDGKIVVGVNRVGNFFKCDYTVLKDLCCFDKITDADHGKIICAQFNQIDGKFNKPLDNDRVSYVFPHPRNNLGGAINYRLEEDSIVVSLSTITSAMHIAAHMGAHKIIVCGHDCGAIDGKTWMEGYYTSTDRPAQRSAGAYKQWLRQTAWQTNDLCNFLRLTYGCFVLFLDIRR